MSKYQIRTSSTYKTARKKLSYHDKELLEEVVLRLANGEALEERYCDHALKGKYTSYRECHIKPDLLLIYRVNEGILELFLAATGSHSDLF